MTENQSKSGIYFEVSGILLLAIGLLAFLSLLGKGGTFGLWCSKLLSYGFGVGAWLIPIVMIFIGVLYICKHKHIKISVRIIYLPICYILCLAFWHNIMVGMNREILPEGLPSGGGLAGGLVVLLLRKYFDITATALILGALIIVDLILLTRRSIKNSFILVGKNAENAYKRINNKKNHIEIENDKEFSKKESKGSFFNQGSTEKKRSTVMVESNLDDFADEVIVGKALVDKDKKKSVIQKTNTDELKIKKMEGQVGYQLPSLNIFEKSLKQKSNKLQKEQQENARLLEETLSSFGVGARIINIVCGPAVTRYELEPAAGVKVSRVVNLADDISLKLATSGVRIEAPIPGKAAIGIEVPNREISPVGIRDVLESDAYQDAFSPLTVALGKDITGQTIIADLIKMPHLLVAGATGAGKSVCINTIISSILCRANPDAVRFILIDPKMVELSIYKPIPHLLTPVVTDAEQAAAGLRWAVQEMERRYNLCAQNNVRDIVRYNALNQDKPLPYIVIIIDELADLMMVAPVDVEDAICRLAQKARAAGIHLVLATQRPSVDVITGTIKANIPSRISFAVSSQTDSRTILDMAGAEKLLGKGDMLYFPVGYAKPVRIQGAFMHDVEVERLVEHISLQKQDVEYEAGVTELSRLQSDKKDINDENSRDELLEQAVRVVLETGQASASLLQRKFRVGFARAARLIDTMEDMKIVGPHLGSRGRDILMTSDQVYSKYFNKVESVD